ncbi:hypothetical protein LTR15_002835 [Elasticomyces elasticus]|nr:hypothetical protein LTR15_002835 [Elasticomyces elasticus]
MNAYAAIITLALLASASALPSEVLNARQSSCYLDVISNPTNMDIKASISQWSSDVDAVNKFLDNAQSMGDDGRHLAASSAMANAQDQLCQLSTFAGFMENSTVLTPWADATCAIKDIQTNFDVHVTQNLQTLSTTTDPDTVTSALYDIDYNYCCSFLLDITILWGHAEAEASLGGEVPFAANHPQVCSTMDCSHQTTCQDESSSSSKVKARDAGTCIVPTMTNPITAQVARSINQWNNDINTVNNFIDTMANDQTLDVSASYARSLAYDELCQLSTLTGYLAGSTTAAVTCAETDLLGNFETKVIDNLSAIVDDPTNSTAVENATYDMNWARCCSLLIDVDFLWMDAVALGGASIAGTPITAQRPKACQAFNCAYADSCTGKDNGAFGAPAN